MLPAAALGQSPKKSSGGQSTCWHWRFSRWVFWLWVQNLDVVETIAGRSHPSNAYHDPSCPLERFRNRRDFGIRAIESCYFPPVHPRGFRLGGRAIGRNRNGAASKRFTRAQSTLARGTKALGGRHFDYWFRDGVRPWSKGGSQWTATFQSIADAKRAEVWLNGKTGEVCEGMIMIEVSSSKSPAR